MRSQSGNDQRGDRNQRLGIGAAKNLEEENGNGARDPNGSSVLLTDRRDYFGQCTGYSFAGRERKVSAAQKLVLGRIGLNQNLSGLVSGVVVKSQPGE
jgi:hypothetical protein